MDAVSDRLGTGRFDRRQTVGEHRVEDVDHLPIAIVGAGELAPYTLHRGRQHPVLEGSAVAQGAGLAGEHRHVMPGVVDRLAAAERARMLGNDASVLADHDAVGIGMNLDRTPDCAGRDRVLVVVEAHQAGLRDRCRHRVESVEPAGIGNELRPLRLEHLPDRLFGQLRMAMRLGVGDAFVEQPGVQLVEGFEPQPRREEALADKPDLVLDLALLPARCRRAGDRIDEVVAAHLQEAAIVETPFADEDRLHRGLHVVVDAASAGALEQGERPVVGVEHHLLRLARIGTARTASGCDRAGHGRPSRSPSRRSAGRPRGSSRTGRLLPAQSSAGRRPPPSIARAPCSIAWRNAARHRSRRHSRARAAPRRSGSTSAAREQPWPHCLPAIRRVLLSIVPASVAAGPHARTRMRSLPTAAPCGPCSATPSGPGRSP